MKRKKICMVTLYGNFNFGNKLQMYAIQKICKNLGFDIEALKVYIPYNLDNIKNPFKKLFIKFKQFMHIILDKIYRNKNFKIFEKQYLNITKSYAFDNRKNKFLEKKYDYFLIGSDQVWNPYIGLKRNFQFFECIKQKPILALSASIGVDNIPKDLEARYIKGLNHINNISVREDKAKEIIEKLTNRNDIEVLLDPSMMLNKQDWEKVSKKPKKLGNEKYILVCFLGELSKERKNKIENFAQQKGYKIINILDENDLFYNSGPSEFVYLEANAQLICTDSFHSCVFGILMETPFMVFEREDENVPMNSRIETLLKKFKLENRKYNGEIVLECDYSYCKTILENEKAKTNNFLKKALEIDK